MTVVPSPSRGRDRARPPRDRHQRPAAHAPDAIAPSFGPGSCERHRALALAAGVACRVERPPSLLLDIDTGADLAALRERLSGARARASHTRAVLGQPERTDVLSATHTG